MHQVLNRIFAISFNDSSAVWNIIFRNRKAELRNPIFLYPCFSPLGLHRESRGMISAIYETSLTIFTRLGAELLSGAATSGPSRDNRSNLKVNGIPGSGAHGDRILKIPQRQKDIIPSRSSHLASKSFSPR
jgi:hypothetical protein